jgi:purine nucleosidase
VGYAQVQPAGGGTAGRDDALRHVLSGIGEPVTLVTLGPLTNVAHAVRSAGSPVRRSALALVQRHLAMAGSFEVGRVDFNAWGDPEALEIVLDAGLRTELVPLDVTRHTVIPAPAIERCAAGPDPLVRWLAAALRWYAEVQSRSRGTGGCAVHDVLPVAEAVAPGLLDFSPRRLKIGVGDDRNRGRTVVDSGGAACRVATSADRAGVRRLLECVLGAEWDRTQDGGM